MKILLIGDYSNLHSQLATTLRSQGHSAVLLSEGSGFQDTQRDIDVRRRLPWKFGGLDLLWRCKHLFRNELRGFDVVALQHPNFLRLRPKHLTSLLEILRGENDKLFLSAAGMDVNYIRACLDKASPIRYNEFRVGDNPGPCATRVAQWMTPDMQQYNDLFYSNIDGAVSALYEYHQALKRILPDDKIFYGGIPVDTRALEPWPMPDSANGVQLFLGRHSHRKAEKGTDIIEEASREVCRRHPGEVHLQIVEDRPYAEYIGMMRGSHVVMDQLYSYTPATNALIAMSRGRIVLSGAEPEYYDFIGESDNRPIINIGPTYQSVVEALEQLIATRDDMEQYGAASRAFVVKHNDATTVASRYLRAWTTM